MKSWGDAKALLVSEIIKFDNAKWDGVLYHVGAYEQSQKSRHALAKMFALEQGRQEPSSEDYDASYVLIKAVKALLV